MIPPMIETHLRERYRCYQHHTHRPAETAQELAAAEHVSGRRVAKAVILKVNGELAIAVVAATDRVNMAPLEEATGSRAELVPEAEFSDRFRPCDVGAEPPLAIFGVPIVADDKLIRERTIVMPAGTHHDAVILDTSEWAWCERVQMITGLGWRGVPAGERDLTELPARRGYDRGDAMLVRDAMTYRAETIGPDETLEAAARRMREVGVGALAVCEDNRVIGVLTDRDIVVRSVADGRNPAVADVRSAMTPQIIACTEDEELATAAERMEHGAVRRAVVLDPEQRLVGLLSVDDIAMHSRVLAGEIIEHTHAPERPVERGPWPWRQ